MEYKEIKSVKLISRKLEKKGFPRQKVHRVQKCMLADVLRSGDFI